MILEKVKSVLRISGTNCDDEIQDLIDAAKFEMISKGISKDKLVDTDPLVIRAINTYCKANFGFDNPEADRFQKCFDSLVSHMTLSGDYMEVPV